MFRLLARAGALLSFIIGSTGCGSSGNEETSSAPTPTVSCMADPRLDGVAADLDKSGELGLLSFHFFDLSPSPPAKGMNTFHVQVRDAAGVPIQGDLQVDLYMPDHGHGTSVEPRITPEAAPGTYTVTPLYLFMPGVWRITFQVFREASDDAKLDDAVLHFCVEG
jgi:YtkA-like